MLKKLACAMFAMAASVGFVGADEFLGTITKVEKSGDVYTLTVQKYKKSEKKFQKGEKDGDPVTMKTTKDTKVTKGMYNKTDKKFETTAVEDGLGNKMFTDIPEAGVSARITATDSTATEISITGGNRKKKKT